MNKDIVCVNTHELYFPIFWTYKSLSGRMVVLANFYCQLDTICSYFEVGNSIEEFPRLDWPLSVFVGQFFEC